MITTGMSAPPIEAVMWVPSTPARAAVAAADAGAGKTEAVAQRLLPASEEWARTGSEA